jgi:hypothetical protein
MERKITLMQHTPNNPTQVEGGELVKLIGEKLGENWGAVKLGRAWCFMKDGQPAGQSTRTFWRAVADVMKLESLSRAVPTKK